jgi:hypothetical protein
VLASYVENNFLGENYNNLLNGNCCFTKLKPLETASAHACKGIQTTDNNIKINDLDAYKLPVSLLGHLSAE